MTQTPILFLGDSPSLKTGLGRIGRDLACLTGQLPEFRVGFLGRSGIASRQLPFMQYTFHESEGWGNQDLIQHVWADFSKGKPGIIFAIWDPSRIYWLTQGPWMASMRGQVKIWTYSAVDSHAPDGNLTKLENDALLGCDRILAYGEYGADVLSSTLGTNVDWLPHGIASEYFMPRDRMASRIAVGFKPRDKVMAVPMTNQARKDWGVAAQILDRLPDWKAWWHIDVKKRHWDIDELIRVYGLERRVNVTFCGDFDDPSLSYMYSGCDVTVLPSSEGFGYPIAESLACGTPILHTDFAGGNWRLDRGVSYMCPSGYRIESQFNRIRPVFDPVQWAKAAESLQASPEDCVGSVEHLFWKNLWPRRWKKWMLEGVAC